MSVPSMPLEAIQARFRQEIVNCFERGTVRIQSFIATRVNDNLVANALPVSFIGGAIGQCRDDDLINVFDNASQSLTNDAHGEAMATKSYLIATS
jgi:hypothetical protein